MIKAPCLGCTRRVLGCHGKCKDYLAFRAECDKRLAENFAHTSEASDTAPNIAGKRRFDRYMKTRGLRRH